MNRRANAVHTGVALPSTVVGVRIASPADHEPEAWRDVVSVVFLTWIAGCSSRSQVWRFLGSLSANVVDSNCICLLLGEYSLPRDLDLPELAVADVVIYLEIERLTSQDLRTLRIYKTRGSAYTEGRQAYTITSDGISFTGVYQGQPGETS